MHVDTCRGDGFAHDVSVDGKGGAVENDEDCRCTGDGHPVRFHVGAGAITAKAEVVR